MPQPFPFERLPRLSRSHARGLRQLPAGGAPEAVERVLGELLAARVVLAPGVPEACSAERCQAGMLQPLLGAVLERSSGSSGERVLLELSPELGAFAVERALGSEASAPSGQGMLPLDGVRRGVLAYVIARALAATPNAGYQLRALVTEPSAWQQVVGSEGALVWPWEVSVDAFRGSARLWCAPGALSPGALAGRRQAPWLMSAELRLTLQAGSSRVRRSELAQLHPGDVVVVDRCALAHDGAGWHGPATLRIEGASRTRWLCQTEGTRGKIEKRERGEDMPMSEGHRTKVAEDDADPLELAADAPMEVCVELARFRIPLAELSDLKAGDVLETGRAIGSEVTLRCGGKAIASGELVDVEGEIGVRVTRTARFPLSRE